MNLHGEAGEIELALGGFRGHVQELPHFSLGGNLVEQVDNLGILGVSPGRKNKRLECQGMPRGSGSGVCSDVLLEQHADAIPEV